ncbi:UvrD-helicase domain-containing protein [Nocardia sp. XZ_19_369]|uniref:HelD family protein n=1 Tax=Nocardia sp. XZ_19_369 TaxID=2769487 RepID=UPI001E460ECB|nr:UvrD-helicase domain-containing protein [Nocardia sp. XZ_19_369]
MLTSDEEHERRYLAETVRLLTKELADLTGSIDRSARTIQEQKEQIWEQWRDMDHAEKAGARTDVNLAVALGERAVLTRERVKRLLQTPYFGRVDFRTRGEAGARAYYIGVHTFMDPATLRILVHDWRAPVSSLFYDFESGEAFFEAPQGTTYGEITAKRQYKIADGRLEYMFDSALNIGDDVLQRELSRSADKKMTNIVATIQREQNAVIRNETAQVLILQGVAGSGKTSIALHRVAFLLYRFKDTLSSDNVMILSPNKVFGDYIASVLPELGEEQVAEIDFDKIAGKFLAKVTEYETFAEQVIKLLDNVDDAATERMRYKSAPEFVTELDAWIASCAREWVPAEIEQKHKRLSADWVADAFAESPNLPIFTRIDRVVGLAVNRLKHGVVDRGGKWGAADTVGVRKQVRAMFPYKDAFTLYKAFYADPARRGLFKPLSRKKIEYADVFPLVYIMIKTGRPESYSHIRHLLVDEMQDYTPVQYAVLRELFSCKMTILGDSNQSVNPFSSSSVSAIHRIFPEADCLELCKSYRSTTEITEFAQRISRNDKLIPIARHGLPPRLIACADPWDQQARILTLIARHRDSEYRSLGIVCKTVAQAKTLFSALAQVGVELTFLDYDSTAFAGGIVITSAHIAKGLEFDVVIVPHSDDTSYATEMDRCMLYIACTRAMHELYLTHEGTASWFLEFAKSPMGHASSPSMA